LTPESASLWSPTGVIHTQRRSRWAIRHADAGDGGERDTSAMGLLTVLVLAAAAVAVLVLMYARSRSEVRSVEDFKNGLEKISPDAVPPVPPKPERRAGDRGGPEGPAPRE
jgi:hypothetical protein